MGGIANETVHLSFAADWSKEVNPFLIHRVNADIEYFMHPMSSIATKSNIMINLFICDMNIKLNELKSLKIVKEVSKMDVHNKYEKLNKLIANIIDYIDTFTLKFSDSEMVNHRLKSYTEYIKEYFTDLEQYDRNT